MKEKLEELGVELIRVDMTKNDQVLKGDLSRAQRKNIPVNLVYPADYPERPAILLEELFGPTEALEALDLLAPDSRLAELGKGSSNAEKSASTSSKEKVVAGK